MRAAVALVTALLAVSSAACASFGGVTSPADGGAPWVELRTGATVLRSDLDVDEASEVLVEIEGARRALVSVIGAQGAALGGTVEVVVFRRERDFHELTGHSELSDGYYTDQLSADIEPGPIMVLAATRDWKPRRLYLHEMVHRFVHATMAAPPTWLNEGLAQYFQSLEVNDDGTAILGMPPGYYYPQTETFELATAPSDLPSARALVAARRSDFYVDAELGTSGAHADQAYAHYDGAWVLVHMLLHGEAPLRAAFRQYLEDMQSTRGEGAFRRAFDAIGMDGLDDALKRYAASSKIRLRAASVPAPSGSATEGAPRVMSAAEVHLLWARLRPHGTAAALIEVERARALEPEAPEPRFLRAALLLRAKQLALASDEIDAALVGRPAEPAYWLLKVAVLRRRLARCEVDEAALEAATERLAAHAVSATQLDAVAAAHLERRRTEEGLQVATRALAQDPTCWACADTYARLLAQEGRLEEALSWNERAQAKVPERRSAKALAARHALIAQAIAARAESPAPADATGPGRARAPLDMEGRREPCAKRP